MASVNATSIQPTLDDALLLLDVRRTPITISHKLQHSDILHEASKHLHLFIPHQHQHEDQDLVRAAQVLIATSKSPISSFFPLTISDNSKRTNKRKGPAQLSPKEKVPKVRKISEKPKKERKQFVLPQDGVRKCSYCSVTSTPMWRHGSHKLI
jgi:hypothetical protein